MCYKSYDNLPHGICNTFVPGRFNRMMDNACRI